MRWLEVPFTTNPRATQLAVIAFTPGVYATLRAARTLSIGTVAFLPHHAEVHAIIVIGIVTVTVTVNVVGEFLAIISFIIITILALKFIIQK